MALLRVFGDVQFFDCSTIEVKRTAPGKWSGVVNGTREFEVIGGRHSGGSSREWYVRCPEFYGDAWLPTTSLVRALRLAASC